jgi:Fe-S oxidoreductase
LESARFAELCTGCSRCLPQCPVRIDIPWLNTVLRHRLAHHDHVGQTSRSVPSTETAAAPPNQVTITANTLTDRRTPLREVFFGRYDAAGQWGSRFAALVHAGGKFSLARIALEKIFGVDRRRRLPTFAATTLVQAASKMTQPEMMLDRPGGLSCTTGKKAVLFADVFTNYGSPARGLATLKVLRRLGLDITVSETSPDGRAPLSQGMLATSAAQARGTAAMLKSYLEEGRDILVVEPSVLSMFRLEYKHLLDRPQERDIVHWLRARTFDPCEYLWQLLPACGLDAVRIFPAARDPHSNRIFFHGHCQQRTIGAAAPTEALLRAAGFDVVTSQVECCGMAGSFGYKKEFYELSMAVADDLFAQVRRAEAEGGPRTLVASGTSCVEQLRAGFARPVLHPMELLATIVQAGRITEGQDHDYRSL